MARRGPGAGLKSVGLIRGPWKKAVGPWRPLRARGPEASVQRVAGLKGLGRKPGGSALDRCFCRASLVCMGTQTGQHVGLEFSLAFPQSFKIQTYNKPTTLPFHLTVINSTTKISQ